MREEFCKFLSNIAIALIISLIIALLFYYGLLPRIIVAVGTGAILALLSLLILSVLSSSDNGISRSYLNENIGYGLISIIGNILFGLLALVIPLSSGNIFSAILVGFSMFFMILNLCSITMSLFCSMKY